MLMFRKVASKTEVTVRTISHRRSHCTWSSSLQHVLVESYPVRVKWSLVYSKPARWVCPSYPTVGGMSFVP